jgi:hypothetical protein
LENSLLTNPIITSQSTQPFPLEGPIGVVGEVRSVLCEQKETQKFNVWDKCGTSSLKIAVHTATLTFSE